jgi:hypothetical protein
MLCSMITARLRNDDSTAGHTSTPAQVTLRLLTALTRVPCPRQGNSRVGRGGGDARLEMGAGGTVSKGHPPPPPRGRLTRWDSGCGPSPTHPARVGTCGSPCAGCTAPGCPLRGPPTSSSARSRPCLGLPQKPQTDTRPRRAHRVCTQPAPSTKPTHPDHVAEFTRQSIRCPRNPVPAHMLGTTTVQVQHWHTNAQQSAHRLRAGTQRVAQQVLHGGGGRLTRHVPRQSSPLQAKQRHNAERKLRRNQVLLIDGDAVGGAVPPAVRQPRANTWGQGWMGGVRAVGEGGTRGWGGGGRGRGRVRDA